jgi:hypothetical protein
MLGVQSVDGVVPAGSDVESNVSGVSLLERRGVGSTGSRGDP